MEETSAIDTPEGTDRIKQDEQPLPLIGPLNVVAPEHATRHNHAWRFEHWMDQQVIEWELAALQDRIENRDPSFLFIVSSLEPETAYDGFNNFIPLRHHYDYWRSVCHIDFTGTNLGPKGSETRRLTALSLDIQIQIKLSDALQGGN